MRCSALAHALRIAPSHAARTWIATEPTVALECPPARSTTKRRFGISWRSSGRAPSGRTTRCGCCSRRSSRSPASRSRSRARAPPGSSRGCGVAARHRRHGLVPPGPRGRRRAERAPPSAGSDVTRRVIERRVGEGLRRRLPSKVARSLRVRVVQLGPRRLRERHRELRTVSAVAPAVPLRTSDALDRQVTRSPATIRPRARDTARHAPAQPRPRRGALQGRARPRAEARGPVRHAVRGAAAGLRRPACRTEAPGPRSCARWPP